MGVAVRQMAGIRRWGRWWRRLTRLARFGDAISHFGQPADFFFHFLARLECDNILRFNFDSGSGSRITSLTGFAPFDFENPEIPKLNSTFLDQRVDDRVERPLHNFFRLELREVSSFGNQL